MTLKKSTLKTVYPDKDGWWPNSDISKQRITLEGLEITTGTEVTLVISNQLTIGLILWKKGDSEEVELRPPLYTSTIPTDFGLTLADLISSYGRTSWRDEAVLAPFEAIAAQEVQVSFSLTEGDIVNVRLNLWGKMYTASLYLEDLEGYLKMQETTSK